jgi:hypothetical protein
MELDNTTENNKKIKFQEILGYVGMILIVGAFLFNPASNTFLIANLSGAILTAIYGFLINSKPVWIMNASIAVFDVLHLLDIELIQL